MASLRNIIRRRTYKERAQPVSRKRFGILEKHKDYLLRAKAYHKKQDTLRTLKEKAANRNPDEFYFKMIRARLVDGVHTKYPDIQHHGKHDNQTRTLLQEIQSEKKKTEKINAELNSHAIFYTERMIDCSRRQLKESKSRLRELEKIYNDYTIQEETQNKDKKRKLGKRKR